MVEQKKFWLSSQLSIFKKRTSWCVFSNPRNHQGVIKKHHGHSTSRINFEEQEHLNCSKDNLCKYMSSETVTHNLWIVKQIHDTCLLLNTETSSNWKRRYITYPIIPPRCTRFFSLSPTSRAFKNSLRLVFYTWDWYIHLRTFSWLLSCM